MASQCNSWLWIIINNELKVTSNEFVTFIIPGTNAGSYFTMLH